MVGSRPFVNVPHCFLCPYIPVPVIPLDNCVYNRGEFVRRNSLETTLEDSSEDIVSTSGDSDSLGREGDFGEAGGPFWRDPGKLKTGNRSVFQKCWASDEEQLLSVVNLHCASGHDPALAWISDYGCSGELQSSAESVYHVLCNESTLLPYLSNPATTARSRARIQGYSPERV